MKATLDLRKFNAAIRAYAKESKKDFSAVLNHAGAKVAVRAIRETPKAKTRWPLRASDDPTRRIKRLQNYTKLAKNSQKLFFWLAKRKGLKGSAAERYAHREWAKRRQGIAEGKAGWIKPALAMGAKLSLRVHSKSKTAAKSIGKRSTPSTLKARLQNMAEAAGTPGAGGIAPVQRAIDYAAADMMRYANRKHRERARRYSGRR